MKTNRSIAFVLSLALLLSPVCAGTAASAAAPAAPETQTAVQAAQTDAGKTAVPGLTEEELEELTANAKPGTAEQIDRDSLDVDLKDPDAAGNDMADVLDEAHPDEEVVRVIILTDEGSVIDEDAAAVPGPAALEAAEELEQEQDGVIARPSRTTSWERL